VQRLKKHEMLSQNILNAAVQLLVILLHTQDILGSILRLSSDTQTKVACGSFSYFRDKSVIAN
jgi:hypothetical protein